jgi:hypothetical protein
MPRCMTWGGGVRQRRNVLRCPRIFAFPPPERPYADNKKLRMTADPPFVLTVRPGPCCTFFNCLNPSSYSCPARPIFFFNFALTTLKRCVTLGMIASPQSPLRFRPARSLWLHHVHPSQLPDAPFERSRWRGGRYACYTPRVMLQRGVLNEFIRFRLILATDVNSVGYR